MEKVKVLVVEGDPVVAKDIKKRLKALGYHVPATVSSGEQAIKKVQSLRPDLVLMAIALEGEMDGVEAAREIHVRFNIPVVYLTQFADEETLQRAKVTEPFGCILKSCDDRELRICIEMALYWHNMEEKLRENEEWLSTTLTSIGDAVIATDREGQVTFMNPVAERLTGWSKQEAAGRPLPDVFRIINQETGKPAEDPATRVVREGFVVGLANHTLLIARDGKEIPIEDSGAPIRNKEGNILGVVLVFHDVTERRQAELELARERNLLHALMDNMPDSIYFKDTDSHFLRINKAKAERIGLDDPAEAIGKTDFDFYSAEFAKDAFKDERAILKSGRPIADKVERIEKPDGTSRWVSATKAPILDETGRVTGIVGISRDVTERIRAEEALRRRVEFERVITTISASFINLPPGEIDHAINRALQAIGDLASVDRSYIFLFYDNATKMDNTHEWCADGIEPQIHKLKGLSADAELPWFTQVITKPDVFHVPSVADLPPEHRLEQEHFQMQDIQSLVVVPMVYRGSPIGFVGFDSVRTERTWTEESITILKIVADIFANALENKRAEEALASSEERFRQIVQQMPYPVEVCAPDGTAILVNPAFLDMFGVPSADQVVGKYNVFRDPLTDKLGIRDEVKNAYAGQTVFIPELVVPLEQSNEHSAPRKTGTVVQEVTMFPVFEPSGGIRQVVTIWKDITERKRAEKERATFARLATRLAASQSVEEATTVVQEESSRLLEWDAHYLAIRRPTDNLFRASSFVDTVDGQPKTFPGDTWLESDLCEPARRVLDGEPVLINRRPGEPSPVTNAFGNTDRLSASLMFAPVRSGDVVIGVLSAQSYTPDRYGESDLAILQRIADTVAPALERVHAEEERRESQARFQELFDDAPVGYHELDTEGRVVRINRTELAMLGYTADDLLGHPVWDFIADVDVSRAAFAAKMADTMPPGRAFERTFRRKDGTTFPVLVSERLLRDNTGRIVGLRTTNQDITERKRAEEQLQESEAKFRQLADTAPVSIFILRGTRFLYLNAASEGITGYSREELTARETLDIVHPGFRELVRDRSMARQRDEKVPSRYEFKIVTKSGEERWLDFAAGTIQYEGSPAVIAAAYDITERKRAEEALRDALSRFESAVERTPLVAIQGVNRDGSVRHWNTASERLYGFTAAEAIGRRLQDLLLPPEDVTGFEKELADIWETGRASAAREWPVRTRQGEERYVYSAMFPVFERGAVAEVFCMDVDVTERIEAEKALHFRLGFENLIATISTNFLALASGEIDTGINGALEAVGEFFGVDRSYIFLFSENGKTMSNTHGWCAGGIEPQAQRLQDLPLERFHWFAQKINLPEVVHIPRVSDLPPEASAEKEEFLSQQIQSLVNVPLIYRGTTMGFLGFDSVRTERIWREDTIALLKVVGEMFVNALERKRAQDAECHSRMITEAVATASLRFLETGDVGTMAQIIVEQATQITGAQLGIAVDLDAKGQPRIRALSTATWDRLGVGLSNQVRQNIMEKGFFPMTLHDSLVFRPINDGVSFLTNAPAEHPHWAGSMPAGHPMIHSFLGVPIRTGDQVMGMIALADRPGGFTDRELHEVETFANTAALALRMARSEEERKRAEDQLRQAQKMEAVGRLAGGIAHDFNNLLTAIIGYADLGGNASHPAEHVHHCFEEIQQAATRAANLTRQLLAFSRRQPLELHLVNLNDVLLDMDKMLRRLIGEDIEMVTLPGADLGTVRVDPTQLEQVIINLVVNARDAMPEGGRLTLETTNVHLDESYAQSHAGVVCGDYVMLAVSDTGIGMTDEIKAHLFEPFFTTKEVGVGTGLGLATCYGIVKQSGGYIWAYSEPGHGTTFRIYFPWLEEKPSALPQRDQVGYMPPGTETILLVEDEEIVRTLAVHVLGDLGYAVLEAANGEQALRVLQEHAGETIHLLLTDVVMPKMGGRALAERLRTIQPELRVLFISGYSENGMAPLTTFEPGVAFLQKPFTPGSLARKIRDVLDS